MKKTILSILAISIVAAILVSAFSIYISADDGQTAVSVDAEGDPHAPVSRDYLFAYMEEFKKQLLAELGGSASGNTSGYGDVTLSKGQTILLSGDCEIIFRGGNAVAVTSSCLEGDGLSDISVGKEIFSGEKLEFGHIYYPSGSSAKKAILITSNVAYFTLKGNY